MTTPIDETPIDATPIDETPPGETAPVGGKTPTDWLDAQAARGWVQDQLGRRGLRQTGAIEQVRARAWSVVWRVPTAGEVVWFKANGGDTRYEAALAEALGRWAPDRVLVPLAVDVERGWQLTPDGGTVLRDAEAGQDPSTWEAFVSEYAQLQRDLTAHVDEMIRLGVPDHRPERLPGIVAALVEDPSVGLSEASRDRLRAKMPEYGQWCDLLARSGIGASLNHDDLHDANVLVRGEHFAFFDWGDAAAAFPFTTLLITLRVVAAQFKVPPDDPLVLRVRDAYLEVFGAEGRQMRDLARLATWTGKPGRALSWRRALAAADAEELSEHGDAISGWVEEVLEPGPL